MTLSSNKIASGGMNIDPMEEGTYPTRVVGVIDLGLQTRPPFGGKAKPPADMVAFTYEFVDEFLKDEDDNDMADKPRWLTEMMPIYNLTAEKAKSTLRYNALDPKGTYGGEFSLLVDTPCMVTIVHNPRQGGGVYENVAAVAGMRLKDATNCPPLVNDGYFFDLDSPDLEVFSKLPPFIQKIITSGLEFEGSKLYGLLEGDSPPEEVGVEEAPSDVSPY